METFNETNLVRSNEYDDKLQIISCRSLMVPDNTSFPDSFGHTLFRCISENLDDTKNAMKLHNGCCRSLQTSDLTGQKCRILTEFTQMIQL